MRIAVVYSLPTENILHTKYKVTDEDTGEAAREVQEALSTKGYDSFLVPVAADNLGVIDQVGADLIFNLIEWTGADLPRAIAACRRIEARGLPFTGATSDIYQLTANKVTMKQALIAAKLPTAAYQVFVTGEEKVDPGLKYPLLIKPALEHCSIGLTTEAVVNDQSELRPKVLTRIGQFHEPMVVEEFVEGREFQVTLLETNNGILVLPPAEILFSNSATAAFLTFSGRWEDESVDYGLSRVEVAQLSQKLLAHMSEVSVRAFLALKLRDYARLDVRLRAEQMVILEANCNPGLGDSDEYGMTLSYQALGLTFADFIVKIVESATRRFQIDLG